MDLSTIIIETERLKLVPTNEKYAEAVFKELTPEITKYLSFDSSGKKEDTLAYIKSSQAKIKLGEEVPVVILDKATSEFVGGGGMHNLLSNKPELGIWIKISAQGNGYGKEAVAGLIKWIKENLQYTYIVYPVAKANNPSKKLIESLGGIIAKEKMYTSPTGKVLDEVEYRLYED